MSIKVVEGQLEFWKMASRLSEVSDSMASNLFRDFVKSVESSQKIGPDVVPDTVDMRPMIESNTGKLVSAIF